MNDSLVVSDPASAARHSDRLGGKAANLARLEALGLPVPPWYAVSTDAYEAALDAALRGRIAVRLAPVAGRESAASAAPGRAAGSAGAAPGDLVAASRDIRTWIEELPLPAGLEAAMSAAHAARIGAGAFVAVRSSASGEDAAGESFAGLHDSFLYVRGAPEVARAVRRVWSSAYSERALAYRVAQHLPLADIAVAVVVQQMITARASGVLFTADPATGSVHDIVISALHGAGEGLVSAGLEADTFVVDKQSMAVDRRLAAKRERLVFDAERGSGLRAEAVPAGLQEASSLSAAEVEVLARLGLLIERHHGCPQDLEFAIDESGRAWLLQARPVTTVAELGPAAGNRLLWDNSNIIESYSGVTSPMTFSFIRRAYAIVYHCFAEVMGIDAAVVRSHRLVFDHMLGLFRGQVYYNLRNWYALVRLFPGYQYNQKFMESMMGVREPAGDAAADGPPSSPAAAPPRAAAAPSRLHRYTVELPALLRLVLRSASNFRRIHRIVGDFQASFATLYGEWSARDLGAMAPHELLALYRVMEDRLLWNWKAPIINDFFVMVFYGTLKRLAASWCGDASGSLQNDLICGEGGIESAEPTKLLLAMAADARRRPEVVEILRAHPPEVLATLVPSDPRCTELAAAVRRYLALYGLRCMNELKLEEPSLRDRPAFLYQVLRNYLAASDAGALDVAVLEARERSIRAAAEQRAAAALGARRGLVPRRAIFRWVLANARLGVKNRENLRFARTRIYGLLRELLRAMGQRFTAADLLDRPEDIFHLTLDEVWDYVEGMAVTTDLRGLAALRRAEFDRYRGVEPRPDDRFETFGMAYHRNLFRDRPRRQPASAAAGEAAAGLGAGDVATLRGTACCPGVVTGAVKVIRTPADDASLAGEILVAERTDPGWVPLYPSVSGLLIERGSILSHSAIVAREMGIPTIVGIPGLVAALRSGQRVRMDGAAGTVHLLDQDGAAGSVDPLGQRDAARTARPVDEDGAAR
jgi:phosphohistidine swiveling domain-containing protein